MFPEDWDSSELTRNNGEPIQVWEVVMGLRSDQEPGNWKRVISRLKEGVVHASPAYNPTSPADDPDKPPEQVSPPYVPTSPAYDPDKPPSSPEALPPVSPDYPPNTPPSKGGSDMRQLQPADITAPNINININVPQIGGGDEDKKDKKDKKDSDPDEENVDKVIGAVKESKLTILKPADGKPPGSFLGESTDDNSSSSSDNKEGGDKKKVTFG